MAEEEEQEMRGRRSGGRREGGGKEETIGGGIRRGRVCWSKGHGSIYYGCVFLSRCDRTPARGKIDLLGRKSMGCSELEMKSMTNDIW